MSKGGYSNIFLWVRKSQIRKFLGSFRNRKSVNFWGVQVRESQIPKFSWAKAVFMIQIRRNWPDDLEHCQPATRPSNLFLNDFRRVQLPEEGCQYWLDKPSASLWNFFLNVFRRVKLPEGGCRDWPDKLEHCQPTASLWNLFLNVFRRVQLPEEGCRHWPDELECCQPAIGPCRKAHPWTPHRQDTWWHGYILYTSRLPCTSNLFLLSLHVSVYVFCDFLSFLQKYWPASANPPAKGTSFFV